MKIENYLPLRKKVLTFKVKNNNGDLRSHLYLGTIGCDRGPLKVVFTTKKNDNSYINLFI